MPWIETDTEEKLCRCDGCGAADDGTGSRPMTPEEEMTCAELGTLCAECTDPVVPTYGAGHFVDGAAEASELDWKPGCFPRAIVVDGVAYRFSHHTRNHNDGVATAEYRSKGGSRITVWND